MKLKILTWNISYAYGMGSDGTDYKPKARDQYEKSLDLMGDVIKSVAPDVIFLQEVDFDSARSSHLNQLDYLARITDFPHRKAVVSWDSPYVPFPGINPLHHFGKTVSGGGILSKYPLTFMQNDLLPKPKENSKLYNFFYLSRYFQMVKIHPPEMNSGPLRLLNLHLEAFSVENRELHLIKLQDRLKDYVIDLACGDFNGTIQLSEEFIQGRWKPIRVPEPTFPSLKPTQTLDGMIYKTDRLNPLNCHVLKTGVVSDHFPVLAEFEVT